MFLSTLTERPERPRPQTFTICHLSTWLRTKDQREKLCVSSYMRRGLLETSVHFHKGFIAFDFSQVVRSRPAQPLHIMSTVIQTRNKRFQPMQTVIFHVGRLLATEASRCVSKMLGHFQDQFIFLMNKMWHSLKWQPSLYCKWIENQGRTEEKSKWKEVQSAPLRQSHCQDLGT